MKRCHYGCSKIVRNVGTHGSCVRGMACGKLPYAARGGGWKPPFHGLRREASLLEFIEAEDEVAVVGYIFIVLWSIDAIVFHSLKIFSFALIIKV